MTAKNNLRRWRHKLNFSMQELAAKSGTSPATINTIEKNQHLPGPDVRVRLAAALQIPEDAIWPEIPEMVKS